MFLKQCVLETEHKESETEKEEHFQKQVGEMKIVFRKTEHKESETEEEEED